MMVISKEQQQQKWVHERELKAAEAASARKNALQTVSENSVVVSDDDARSDLHIVKISWSLQATVDFDDGF